MSDGTWFSNNGSITDRVKIFEEKEVDIAVPWIDSDK